MCTVVNKHKEEYDIYIGRGSKWGNPFPMGAEWTREEVVEKYRQHLWRLIQEGKIPKQDLIDLQGKRLGCFCAPLACHGDILVRASNWALSQ